METLKQIYILNNFDEGAAPIMKVNADYLLEHGIHPLTTFKQDYPKSKLLLDIKVDDRDFHIVDRKDLSNIDFITVQGGIHRETILYVLRKAKESHMNVVVDLSGVHDLNDALEDMLLYGVDYVSIDNDDVIQLPN